MIKLADETAVENKLMLANLRSMGVISGKPFFDMTH
jgi:hypothetical protein